jgi:hypothetical protein
MIPRKQLLDVPAMIATQNFRISANNFLIPTGDVSSSNTLYLLPCVGPQICLYDPLVGSFTVRQSGVQTLAMSGMTAGKNHDVFAKWSGSSVLLLLSAAWTSDTVRADAIDTTFGVSLKASDTAQRLVGTIRAINATQIDDTEAHPWVWNQDNRVMRTARTPGPVATVSTTSTTYVGIGTSFDTTLLSGALTPARATLTIFLNNTVTGNNDGTLGILTGASTFTDIAGVLNDSAAIQRVVAERDIQLPIGATFVTAAWKMAAGSAGAIQCPASVRTPISQAGSSSLQLSYPR